MHLPACLQRLVLNAVFPLSTDVRLVALWVPRALPEVNAILSSFGTDVAQLRDMEMNRLIFFYPSPRSESCVTYRTKRNGKTSIHDRNIFRFNIIIP